MGEGGGGKKAYAHNNKIDDVDCEHLIYKFCCLYANKHIHITGIFSKNNDDVNANSRDKRPVAHMYIYNHIHTAVHVRHMLVVILFKSIVTVDIFFFSFHLSLLLK